MCTCAISTSVISTIYSRFELERKILASTSGSSNPLSSSAALSELDTDSRKSGHPVFERFSAFRLPQ